MHEEQSEKCRQLRGQIFGGDLVEKAMRIATLAHAGQLRKDDLPFIVHPFMVSMKLVRHGFPDIAVAAALTHDVLEDTDFPEDKLMQELGEDVFTIVKAVTYDESLPWEEKKLRYIDSVRRGCVYVKAVSVADKIHNLESFIIAHEHHGPSIWSRFRAGKEEKRWFEREVLRMFREAWEHPLIDEYERLLECEGRLA